MPFHVRVLRRVLLLGSVVTLTGIHHDGASLHIGWRLSQLVLVFVALVGLVSTLVDVVMLQQVHEALVSVSVGIDIFLCLLVLFWFLCRRRSLHLLLRQTECLEIGGDDLYRPGDTTPLYCQIALPFVALMLLLAGVVAMRSSAEFRYPHLAFRMWLPAPLRCGAGFVLVFVLQVMFAVMLVVEVTMFTTLVAGLADAAALQLCAVLRAVLNICLEDVSDPTITTILNKSAQVSVTPASVELGDETIVQDGINSERVTAWPGAETVDDSSIALHRTEDVNRSSAELVLRRQSERYRLVHRLVSGMTDAFSAPLLWLHAAVATILLLTGYVAALQLSGQVEASKNAAALCMTMVYWLVHLSSVAVAGSRLIRQSEQLRDVVAKQCWSARMSAAARGELQVLMEQTRTPLALDVWGLFSVQKSVLLSVLSFVLTYFVIMLQMIR